MRSGDNVYRRILYFITIILVLLVFSFQQENTKASPPESRLVKVDLGGCKVKIPFPSDFTKSEMFDVIAKHFKFDWCEEIKEARNNYENREEQAYLDCEYQYPPSKYPRNFRACLREASKNLDKLKKQHNKMVYSKLEEDLSLFDEIYNVYPYAKNKEKKIEVAKDMFLRIQEERTCKWCESELYRWITDRNEKLFGLTDREFYERVEAAAMSVIKKEAAEIE